MMFISIKARLLFFLMGIMLTTGIAVSLIAHNSITARMTADQDGFARNILRLVMLDVNSKYDSLLRFEMDEIGRRRLILASDSKAVLAMLTTCRQLALEGVVDDNTAQALALSRIDRLSGELTSNLFLFDREIKGIWHPDALMLGQDWSRYRNLRGREALPEVLENLEHRDSDYTVMFWAPSRDALQTKHMVHFQTFEPWGWILGAAQPLKDMEASVVDTMERMVHDIGQTLKGIRVAENGYVFLFSGQGEILIHPMLRDGGGLGLFGTDMGTVMTQLQEAYDKGALPFRFKWQTLNDEEPLKVSDPEWQVGYMDYFRAMDWYVVYTLPEADLAGPARELTHKVVGLVAAIFLASSVLAFLVTSRAMRPVEAVTRYVEAMLFEGSDDHEASPSDRQDVEERELVTVRHIAGSGRDEAGRLANAFVSMQERLARYLDRLNMISREKERFARELEEANKDLDQKVRARTMELESANRRLSMEIAERKRSSREIRNLNTFLDTIIDNASVWVSVTGEDGMVLVWNKAAAAISGYGPEEMKGRPAMWDRLFPGENIDHAPSGRDMDLSRESWSEARGVAMACKDGSIRQLSLFTRHIDMDDGEILFLMIAVDVTERIRAEAARSESDARYRGMFENMADGVIVLARIPGRDDFIVKEMNPAAESMESVHRNDVVGRPMEEVLPALRVPGLRETAILVKETGLSRRLETHFRKGEDRTGNVVWRDNFLYRLPSDEVVLISVNVTERKRIQAETMRSSHLASIGELAAGVAHEINNPINGIINYAQIMADTGQTTTDELDLPRRIIQEGERIAVIVRNLLHFARKGGHDVVTFGVNEVLEKTLDLLKVQLTEDGISISIRGDDHTYPVRGKPHEMQQVFLNIISNARYALNARHGEKQGAKSLAISMEVVAAEAGELVRVTFRDNGTGIPINNLGRVFDPFHTTKPVGEGTGLGLSISYGIVRDHGGDLRIDSNEGEFTEVFLDLPLSLHSLKRS